MKALLPRSKKPLEFNSNGTYDKKQWDLASKEMGPAARVGDLVQVTKVTLDDDRILLEINGGVKDKKKWYERVEVGMGTRTTPIRTDQNTNAVAGTNIAIVFSKPLSGMPAVEVKKLLLPILDFERRTATQNALESLPPEIKAAVQEKRVVEGMDKDQVILAIGRPVRKVRDTKDGVESEDWIYGQPPGKIVFVTFTGSKVAKVKETYASLGGSTVPNLPVK